ncbi:MAG: hypothetical protein IJR58_06105 [Lachnospiraceae bacterium]|nr:hypothetical protein [Lachnospiraceae bacterium]
MATVICKICGKQIREEAVICPRCGDTKHWHPLKQPVCYSCGCPVEDEKLSFCEYCGCPVKGAQQKEKSIREDLRKKHTATTIVIAVFLIILSLIAIGLTRNYPGKYVRIDTPKFWEGAGEVILEP